MGVGAIKRNIFFAIGALAVLSGVIVFRGRISSVLFFGAVREPGTALSGPSSSSSISVLPLVPVQKSSSKEAPSASPVPQPVRAGIGAVRPAPRIPPYFGRDPGEVRPVPEEVKLFSDEQKTKIYNTIETNGRLVKAHPAYYNGWMLIGILKKTIGDYEGARDAWEYAGMLEPQGSVAFSNLGELYWRYLHDYPKSEANFKVALARRENDPGTYVSLADLYHYSYQEKSALATPTLLRGLEKIPGDQTLMRHLAHLYELEGNITQAIVWWEKVSVASPDDTEVKAEITRLEGKQGSGL